MLRFRQWIPQLTLLGCALALLVGCQHGVPQATPEQQARVQAEEVLNAMGGREALDAMRFLRFDFVVTIDGVDQFRRVHLWDRETGRYRLEVHQGTELLAVVLFNTQTKELVHAMGSGEWSGLMPSEAVSKAYAAHINDSYWLLSATKMNDPGTQLEILEPQIVRGQSCPTLQLSFEEGVGLTSRDRYWFHLDPETQRPLAWSFVLKGEEKAPMLFYWNEWRPVGPMLLPSRFESEDGKKVVHFPVLFSVSAMDDGLFENIR